MSLVNCWVSLHFTILGLPSTNMKGLFLEMEFHQKHSYFLTKQAFITSLDFLMETLTNSIAKQVYNC
jgi:hypothetical protein